VTNAWQLQQAIFALRSGAQRLLETDEDLHVSLPDELPEEVAAVRNAVVAVARQAREAKALHEMAKKMAQETADRARRFEHRAEQLRGLVFAAMDALGTAKIEAPDVTLSLRAGSPAVVITDETKIPDEYWKVTRTVSLSAIRDDIKQGVVVEGAEMQNGMPSLIIKGS